MSCPRCHGEMRIETEVGMPYSGRPCPSCAPTAPDPVGEDELLRFMRAYREKAEQLAALRAENERLRGEVENARVVCREYDVALDRYRTALEQAKDAIDAGYNADYAYAIIDDALGEKP